MKNITLLDKFLPKIGLIRKAKYDATQESWQTYTELLSNEAKEKDVKLVLNNTHLENIHVDLGLFQIGSGNSLENCVFTNTPPAYGIVNGSNNWIRGCSFV